MSDQLLERIAVSLEGLLAHAKASLGGAAAGAKTTASTAGAAPSAADKKAASEKAAAKKAADDKAAAEKAAADKKAAEKPKGPAAGTKAPGGKHTIDQVREIIRKVANDKSLGRESAKDILRDDGGVDKVGELKPEKYDAVFEACEVALAGEGEGNTAASTDEEDDFA